jgi:hypothetical protein
MEYYNVDDFHSGAINFGQLNEQFETQIATTAAHIAEINKRTIVHKHVHELMSTQYESTKRVYREALEAEINCRDVLKQEHIDQYVKEDCDTVIVLIDAVVEIDARLMTQLESSSCRFV